MMIYSYWLSSCLLDTFLSIIGACRSQFLTRAEIGKDDHMGWRGELLGVATLTCKEACNKFSSFTPFTSCSDEKSWRLRAELWKDNFFLNPSSLWKAKYKLYLLEMPRGHFTALPFVSIAGTERALKASHNDFPFSKRSGRELLPNSGCRASCGCSRLVTPFKADIWGRGVWPQVICPRLLAY